MLLILLCFLMKLVDLSILNRSRNGSAANNPNHHNHHHHHQNIQSQINRNHNYHNNNNNHYHHYNQCHNNFNYYDGIGNVGQQQQHEQSFGRREQYFGRRPLSSTGSDSSNSSYSSSDSAKENQIYNGNVNNNNEDAMNTAILQQQRMLLLLQQQRQQIEHQLKQLTPQQYQQLLLQQKQQQQQNLQPKLKSNIKNNNSNIKNGNKKTWAEIGSKKGLAIDSDINIQGIKSHRGMTEHPNTELSSPLYNSSSLSSSPRRPPSPPSVSVFSNNLNNQLNYINNSSPKQQRYHPTTLISSPTKTRQNIRNLQQNNYIIQNSINQQQQQPPYKRPLTSPNATIFNLNNYYNNGMPYNCNNFNAYNNIQSSIGSLNDINGSNNSINDSNNSQDNLQQCIEDELTDEHLKQNVAIVLNNLDRRYQSTLRSIILNEQINHLALSYNNNEIFTTTTGPNYSNDIITNMMAGNLLSSPVNGQDDYNSNPANIGIGQQQHLTTFATAYGNSPNTPTFATLTAGSGHLNCSIASSHDFTHDNSDYQWFLDYGYRDGVAHQSVLSSLSASYNGIGELSYYEDLAKDIDANLAEVDMESFRTEDIHSLLTHIPPSFCSKKHTTSEIDNSICKSELLFSPVKESHISTDSLDLDAYQDDADIILTCKANKDNYTIAFEGSTLYSDESFYAEPNELNIRNRQNFINLHSNLDDIVKRKSLEVSMCRSDNAFTTWSKLKKNSALQLQRYPSGNNNTSINIITRHAPHCFVRKSSSLPNLRIRKEIERQLNVSQAISTSTVDSKKLRNLLPMCQIPVSAISIDDCSSTDQTNETGDGSSNAMHTTDESSIGNGTDVGGSGIIKHQHQQNQPAFNLVKLFIKQKSSSSDTCMDVSSGCWPSSDASTSSEQQQNHQRCRKKIMHDSDKSSSSGTPSTKDTIMKQEDHHLDTELKIIEHTDNDNHNEVALEHTNEDSSYQLDSLDICEESNCSNKDSLNTTPTKKTKTTTELSRDSFEGSPTHKLRMQQQQQLQQQILRNPQLFNLAIQNNNNNLNKINNNNNSLSSDATSRTSDNLTQIYCNNNADRIKIPTEVVTRSIQTSFLLKDRVRFVPPSFLAKLNKLGDERPAPVYVIYPSYALPDLGFVKNNLTDIILSPFNYKAALAAASGNQQRNFKIRPTSLTRSQEEVLKNIDHKNIADWKSLVTLLPIEYRKQLKHIPEADVDLDPECSMKPLFCMSPPLRRNVGKSNVCDCAIYYQQQHQTCDSSSGSSQQPSSGYRGSSTLLTDSDFDPPTLTSNTPGSAPILNNGDPLKNMFVYQYENNRIDSEILQEKLPPSGRTPKGILRRNLKSGGAAARLKRNSMFEEENSNVRNLEKRRSLQEPPYDEHHIIEDYLAEAPEDEKDMQYSDEIQHNLQLNRNDINFILDNHSKSRGLLERKSRRDYDLDARIRAENFLSNVPKSDLKYYAEIASILESTENNSTTVQYDAVKLKNEVSRALCQQKRVSFIQNGVGSPGGGSSTTTNYLQANANSKKFTTPPNSPNISMAGLRINNNSNTSRLEKVNCKEMTQAEKERQNKISSNRFKRLQIQWELLSKDSSMMLKDLASEKETKSGGSTPTSASGGLKSRIPRPVSYPASKRKNILSKLNSENRTTQEVTKAFRSPSRIVPPKKYTAPPNTSPTNVPIHAVASTGITNATAQTNVAGNRARTPNNRTPNNGNVPKQRVQSPRATPRTR